MIGPEVYDAMTIAEIKDGLRNTFKQAWMREIQPWKPDESITKDEMICWTACAAAKMELAIKALVKEEIEKVLAESA